MMPREGAHRARSWGVCEVDGPSWRSSRSGSCCCSRRRRRLSRPGDWLALLGCSGLLLLLLLLLLQLQGLAGQLGLVRLMGGRGVRPLLGVGVQLEMLGELVLELGGVGGVWLGALMRHGVAGRGGGAGGSAAPSHGQHHAVVDFWACAGVIRDLHLCICCSSECQPHSLRCAA